MVYKLTGRRQRVAHATLMIQGVQHTSSDEQVVVPPVDDLLQNQLEQVIRQSLNDAVVEEEPLSQSALISHLGTDNSQVAGSPEYASQPLNKLPERMIQVTATLVSKSCQRFCPCRCHLRTQFQNPRWMTTIFGSIYFQSNSNVFFQRRSCDYRRCRRGGSLSVRLMYCAPAWMFNKVFFLSVFGQQMTGINATLAIRSHRFCPDGEIWGSIETGIGAVQEVFTQSLNTIYDVDEHGESLLHVSLMVEKSAGCFSLILTTVCGEDC